MSEPHNCRVLVIDDDEVDRELVERCLVESGLPVTLGSVADCGEGLARLHEGSWDCVLLDFRFPQGDAFDLFAEVLQQSCAQRPPVVLLTGLGGERIAVEAMKRGAQDYLAKHGITPALLRRAVEGAIDKAQMQKSLEARDEKLRRLSLHDALTGLANRTLFIDRLVQCIRVAERSGESFAVLMMDLHLFKDVNDTFGHDAGDEVLRGVASRVGDLMRQSDTIARMGGDEFAAVLAATGDMDGARVVAHKICAAIDEPFTFGAEQVHIGISIGVALWPEHGRDRVTLLRHADGAMYEAKRSGGGITVHGARADAGQIRAALIADGLSRAVSDEEFVLNYQPQLDLRGGEVVGVEALLRWKHPDLGRLPPMDFIPSAERSAVIRPLTLQVIERGLADLDTWRARGIDIGLAVNLAPRLLRDATLAADIAVLLGNAGIAPRLLTLELSETRMVGSMAETERGLAMLAALGVRISIDDFGTGFTSLEHLRALPVDEIKIDGTFVAGLQDDGRDTAIVRSILDLGAGFGVRVVAEGIESDQTWRLLQALGCDHGQGFRFSKPLPAGEFVAWRERWLASERGAVARVGQVDGGRTMAVARIATGAGR